MLNYRVLGDTAWKLEYKLANGHMIQFCLFHNNYVIEIDINPRSFFANSRKQLHDVPESEKIEDINCIVLISFNFHSLKNIESKMAN